MNKLPRDVFVDAIYQAALKNRNIVFISADFGAMALDQFRQNLPEQFIHAGISEQNMSDLASGLALNGKIVYIYAMIPFVTFRCFEQLKVALATMNQPVTVFGVGSGYSYDDAGPTHYATEDISCMRALGNIEILNPSDTVSTLEAARLTYEKPQFRYIRLDRKFLPDVYSQTDKRFLEDGVVEVESGSDVCIFTNGYMLPKARQVRELLAAKGVQAGIADVFRIKPLSPTSVKKIVEKYSAAVTLEEHFLSGGLGSAFAEVFVDEGIFKPLKRIGVDDQYVFDNGGREHILSVCGLTPEKIEPVISRFLDESLSRQR